MFCVLKMFDHYGDYGTAETTYIRESKGDGFTDLFPSGVTFIELNLEKGTYKVKDRDGCLIVFSTVSRGDELTDLEFRRELFNSATDSAYHYGAKDAFVIEGLVKTPVDEYEAELLKEERTIRNEGDFE
ncbi:MULTISPECIES: hypothetical protein [Bacillus]|uniref:hypothetical protein n=1 Tax=Bacillus TaxID=1386 RepID=UPI00080EAAAF|nr:MULTISPECIES: hypothetical protein [Bacillus]MDE1381829.1 hypothetical protein [Bacillus paralicheniformis]TAI52466.1 hypothetical protein CXP52_08985 [Bacillus paralicheniformis]GIN75368.1 hypothetical protein J41TS8_04090 [Bacillus sp. J41TS8]